ncbi:MAG: ADP-glyceromanno-heptose 6-epimerase [Leptospiraceae bacterium]|nr:ADP-glyceromanno-heptose 6-epimerase [Leptospiraceae bacterium]MCP5511668.1 ADP-glyceromanno-heptose 6-epimerase [Leptospiraceae bacterium]
MNHKYIITGGAGLIGSNVIEELNRMGETDILIIDHLGTSEKWKNLTRLQYTDYIEKDKFLSLIQNGESFGKVTHCIHLGACSSTTESDASYLISNNYNYTQVVGAFAITRGIRFLYASSAATYGLGEFGYREDMLHELRPLNMYGYSKHMYDLYAHRFNLLDKITGLKYFNVYGFGEAHKGDMRSVVLKGYEQIRDTSGLKLFKSYRDDYRNGEQKRDFLYVRDAAKITLYLLHNNHYGIFNVGRGIAETWMDLANALFSSMGKSPKIEFTDMPEYLRPKYQYYTCADIKKLKNTGYPMDFHSLQEGIESYVNLLNSESH